MLIILTLVGDHVLHKLVGWDDWLTGYVTHIPSVIAFVLHWASVAHANHLHVRVHWDHELGTAENNCWDAHWVHFNAGLNCVYVKLCLLIPELHNHGVAMGILYAKQDCVSEVFDQTQLQVYLAVYMVAGTIGCSIKLLTLPFAQRFWLVFVNERKDWLLPLLAGPHSPCDSALQLVEEW